MNTKDGNTPRLFVFDTNVPMTDPSSIYRCEEHNVFICNEVLGEIDNNKRGHENKARNAREFSRQLDKLLTRRLIPFPLMI